jgi:N-acyl homoserine lactone hydrolase
VRIWAPVLGFAVETVGGWFLVDTGMHVGHIEQPSLTFGDGEFAAVLTPQMSAIDALPAVLGRAGLHLDDITAVINTHLHFDHAGNNAMFPGRPIYVQREHREHAAGNPSFPEQYWDLASLDYELLEGEGELAPGIAVICTPGHVPGHQSVVVTLDGSVIVICGDAVFSRENLELDSWSTQSVPEAAHASADRLRSLAADHGAELIFGHDPEQAQRLLYPPAEYR